MNIQDRRKTLTVEELRRRYNLDALDKDRKAIKLQKYQLNKVDAELNDFVEITTKNIKELQDQVDGNITTWFFNGVPTMETEPAINWTTDTDKNNHLGDLYYDQNTGYAYRFYLDGTTNEYGWIQVIDSDVAEALAVANAAQDTADSKRRVFVVQPTPPYDIGDIWIKEDTDLYRCRVSKSEGSFNTADWIRATNYTDDTVALGTKAELDQFKTQVTENYVSNATLETTVNSITGKVEETYTYVTTVENQVNDITTTTQTSTGGNSLYITDALESNALEYHVEGKSEQDETPTPDAPVEIKTIPSIKNLLNSEFEQGSLSPASGIILHQHDTNSVATTNLIEVEPNTTYTFSYDGDKKIDRIAYFDKNKAFISRSDSLLTKTFTTIDDCYYIRFNLWKEGILATDITNPMLEEGTITHPHVPYGAWAKVKITGKNLFDKDNAPVIKGYTNSSTGTIVASSDVRTSYIKCKSNTTYTAQKISGYLFNLSYSDVEPAIGTSFSGRKSVNTGTVNTITTGNNAKYLIIEYYKNDSDLQTILDSIMIEEGTTTEYEEYKEKEVLINLQDNELSSIGDTKDTLDIVNGQVVIDKKIGKFVLKGTENWAGAGVTNVFYISSIKDYAISNNIPYSNYYKGVSNVKGASDMSKQGDYAIGFINQSGDTTPIFYIKDTRITSNNNLKTWLNENNTTVYYILAEPQQITLPNTNIELFEGVNHITLVDDLETTTSIKYLRNTPISGEYVIQQQLDATNSNLANTTDKTNQNASDINSTNTNLNNNYYNKDQIDVMNTSTQDIVTQIKNTVETTTTATNLQISVLQEQLANGATKVDTGTGYTFDINGLKIQKTDSEMSSLLDNDGLVVKRDTTEVLTVRSSGVQTENLTVRTYFTIGDNTRAENYKGGTGFFYIGGDN